MKKNIIIISGDPSSINSELIFKPLLNYQIRIKKNLSHHKL